MFFNIQFVVGDNSKGDIDLFGLKISVFTPSAYPTAGAGADCCESSAFYICSTNHQDWKDYRPCK